MKIIHGLAYSGIIVAIASLSVAFLQISQPVMMYVVLLLGSFWGLSHWRRWNWANNLAFALNVLSLGGAAWIAGVSVWLFVALAGMIVAWDLGRFIRIIESVDIILNEGNIIKQHLIRLGVVLVIGLGLSFLALNLNFKTSFDWMLILAFVMMLAISRAVGYLRAR